MTLLPWFGGKVKHADWILSFMPEHHTYVEPFGGAMAVLLRKRPSAVEVYNDVDRALVNFWRVVRDARLYPRLERRLSLTPYSRDEWNWARRSWRQTRDPVERAARWWVAVRQAFAAEVPRRGGSAGWSFAVGHSARGMSGEVSKYLSSIEALPHVHARLQRVQVECSDWRMILDRYDAPGTLFYLDPPYVPETRRAGGYAHELAIEDHRDLVTRLLGLRGGGPCSPGMTTRFTGRWSRRDGRCAAAR